MRNFISFFFLFGIASSACFAAAQIQSQTLDVEAIRAASQNHMEEAEALAKDIHARSQALQKDARETRVKANANHRRYTHTVRQNRAKDKKEVFDFDRMITDHAKMAEANLGNAPRFIAFASLSMPQKSLKALARNMKAAGGVTVLRGFPGGSAKTLTQMLSKMASGGEELSTLGIDPRLFRTFDIKVAPSFVMASSDFSLCDGFECKGALPPHDRMTGNVSVEYVLETFASGGPGSHLAALHLARLERSANR